MECGRSRHEGHRAPVPSRNRPRGGGRASRPCSSSCAASASRLAAIWIAAPSIAPERLRVVSAGTSQVAPPLASRLRAARSQPSLKPIALDSTPGRRRRRGRDGRRRKRRRGRPSSPSADHTLPSSSAPVIVSGPSARAIASGRSSRSGSGGSLVGGHPPTSFTNQGIPTNTISARTARTTTPNPTGIHARRFVRRTMSARRRARSRQGVDE